MKVFETAQLMNDKLNGGNKRKFPVTLAIVGEIICICNLRFGCVGEAIFVLSSGIFDDHIGTLINDLDNENELKMIENVQNFFEPRYEVYEREVYEMNHWLSKVKSALLWLGLGLALWFFG